MEHDSIEVDDNEMKMNDELMKTVIVLSQYERVRWVCEVSSLVIDVVFISIGVLMLQFEIVSCDNLYDLEGENDTNADGMIVDFV